LLCGSNMTTPKIPTDFNGFIEEGLLCLAHEETPLDHEGNPVRLSEGAYVIAYTDDNVDDEGQVEYIVVSGSAERSPRDITHRGSVWCVRVDERGVRYLPSLDEAE
jgi:hypothetical protein